PFDCMKPKSCTYLCLYIFLVIFLALSLIHCGSSQAATKKTSGLKKRVLVSNTIGNVFRDRNTGQLVPGSGAVDIMDASTDRFVYQYIPLIDLFPALHIPAFGAAGMATSGGMTAVINATGNGLTLIDNAKEEVTQTVSFVQPAEDVAISPDGKTA